MLSSMTDPAAPVPNHATELFVGGSSTDLVITCDHASPHLPAPWSWPSTDHWLADKHWASDLGAALITRELASRLSCTAALARFSRLLVDANRDLESPTLFREVAEGRAIALNQALDDAARRSRIEQYYVPYHTTIDELVAARPQAALFSVHTFTPEYEGQPRRLEAGVLFTDDDLEARVFATSLIDQGYDTGLNEPYSGLDGLMYGIERHALQHRRRCLEVEVRQDIALDPVRRRHMVDALERAVRRTLIPD
ncbi:MAG: N-formylglutamate amidohydrolase [Myxococcales bacterium FL481]|nr:MAG: N-formylglutamate amidohydrolase [Myxococcales bacterium FL481]